MKRKLFWLSILLVLVLGMYFILPLFLEGMARFLMVRDRIEPVDLIVVLAGDNNGERVREAVKLYKEGYAKKMLMTGGPLAWKLSAASWMKKHALAVGVPGRAILLEDRSRSTLENALLSLPILKKYGIRSVILVTSPTHSRRAMRVFKKCYSKEGIRVLSYPAREAEFVLPGWWTRHEDTQRVMWEYIALVYYFLKGY
jgi:uncharacterized SAM-binding protein YcdF (DUF218 family)